MTEAGFDDGWTDPRWCNANWAAALFAVDPVGTGISLRALAGPVRVRWLALLRGLLPAGPLRTIPLNVPDARLLGGLDLAATLQAGRPVAERGILAEANGGVVLLAMAERLSSGVAARIAAVIDQGVVSVARDGPVQLHAARVGVVAIDEGMAEEERAPAALRDRLAFHVELSDIGARVLDGPLPGPAAVAAARRLLPVVRADDGVLDGLCRAAAALGIASVRAPLAALRAACAAAALAGRDRVMDEDAALACRLVLAPRATVLSRSLSSRSLPSTTLTTRRHRRSRPKPSMRRRRKRHRTMRSRTCWSRPQRRQSRPGFWRNSRRGTARAPGRRPPGPRAHCRMQGGGGVPSARGSAISPSRCRPTCWPP